MSPRIRHSGNRTLIEVLIRARLDRSGVPTTHRGRMEDQIAVAKCLRLLAAAKDDLDAVEQVAAKYAELVPPAGVWRTSAEESVRSMAVPHVARRIQLEGGH